jgi:hypothetical protein
MIFAIPKRQDFIIASVGFSRNQTHWLLADGSLVPFTGFTGELPE